MSYFICNNCRHLFTADELPDQCPYCRRKEVSGIAQGNTGFTFPSVRAATDAEISAYESACKSEIESADMLTWISRLNQYDLSDDEYHVALLLLYYFRSVPGCYTSIALQQLISANSSEDTKSDVLDKYLSYKKHFTSCINAERRTVGTNDTNDVAYYRGKDSASAVLMKFRQEYFHEMAGNVPNLGNVRRIDLKRVAFEPGDGYLHFLSEWYNSLDKTTPENPFS